MEGTRPFARGRMRRAMWALGGVTLGCTASFGSACAQALSYSAGLSTAESAHTYTWALAYDHTFTKHWGASLTWLNEGHVPNHHRDGQAIQAWARLPLFEDRLIVDAGVGPYLYFDTTLSPGAARYSNEHGVGALMSLRAAYAFTNRWKAQLQLNRVAIRGAPDSTGVLLGVGYQFDVRSSGAASASMSTPYGSAEHPASDAWRTPTESSQAVTLYAGQTILNSTASQTAFATALDWRKDVADHVAWTVGYLHESSRKQARRDGVTSQVWAKQALDDGRLELSAGVGLYYAINEYEGAPVPGPGDGTVSALISVSAAYRLSHRWQARLTWNRVATHYDRDTDVIVGGLGIRF